MEGGVEDSEGEGEGGLLGFIWLKDRSMQEQEGS